MNRWKLRRLVLVPVIAVMTNRGLWLHHREPAGPNAYDAHPVFPPLFLGAAALLVVIMMWPGRTQPWQRAVGAALVAAPYVYYAGAAMSFYHWDWERFGGTFGDLLLAPLLVGLSWGRITNPHRAEL